MAIELIDKIKPKNNGSFAMVDAEDVAMPDGTRLSDYNPGSGLPDVSDSDNGKVLSVVGGQWQMAMPETTKELPSVTSSDNGKVLGVVNGAWKSVTPEFLEELPSVSTSDNGKILQVVGGKVAFVTVDDSSVKTFVDEYISSALEGDY